MSRRSERGQALTEFAVVIPLFLLLAFGTFDVARVVWANNSLANAAREGARQAIVHGGSDTTACPYGPQEPDAVTVAATASCPYPAPSREAIRVIARNAAVAGGTNLVVSVCYGAGCNGDDDVPGATNVRGTAVTVRVTSDVELVTASLLGLGAFSLSGSSTMLVNH